MSYKIFMIEDDAQLAQLVASYLAKYDYDVMICEDFKEIDVAIKESQPDLILMDINIPFYDGFYWCQEIRKTTFIPIMFMSARSEESDQVRAMMSGGDDYITKPFSYDLLLAKVNSQIRRNYGDYANNHSIIKCGDCSFNQLRFTLKCGQNQVDLSKNESLLIHTLFDSFPNSVSREKILSKIWDNDLFVEENTLNVTVSRVRKKLKDIGSKLQVVTIRSIGYKITYENP
ncbi:response regulator transcription factor [Staphylococcus felis]|uniref:response regulator transcription factor n=1 Tax=Staphylococcus felis TaxID=46127 RepID=UPI000CD1481A|nr:response regulator transcription factor [Staphylococcus felis]AVP36018.1 DNA-binding response regulator [Staphylococcus felis]PNZ33323.1 DNA-binding response regulator [Staphylococcus felis]QQB04012.1 response regulator transcription factor [Staphylococcus felis]